MNTQIRINNYNYLVGLFCAALSLLATVFAAGAWAESPDYGNSISTAASVSINSSTAGTIGYAGDLDYFKISLPTSGTLTVGTTGSTDTYGILKNSGGGTVASSDANSFIDCKNLPPWWPVWSCDDNFLIAKFVPAGTYYVAVRHYSSTQTGNYTLDIKFQPDDHGDDFVNARSVNVNSSVTGAISYARDWDYFRIVVPYGGYLTTYTTGSTDTYGFLYNSSGTVLVGNDNYGGVNFRISKYVAAGTYYVGIRHYSSTGMGSYTFVNQWSPDPDDHGNTFSTATSTGVNSSKSGVINYAGDFDYFRIAVPYDETLTVRTTGSTDTYGLLYNSSMTLLAANDDYTDRNFYISRAVTAGTYYVAIRHWSSTGVGNYTFVNTLNPPRNDDHVNIICDAATVVTVPTRTHTPFNCTSQTGGYITFTGNQAGTINYAGDIDVFKICMPRENAMVGELEVRTFGSTDTYGSLYDAGRNFLVSNDNAPDGLNSNYNFAITRNAAPGSCYYIGVRHSNGTGTGSYSLSVRFTVADGLYINCNPGGGSDL